MKKFHLILLVILAASCKEEDKTITANVVAPVNTEAAVTEINTVLNNWHKAAAEANFEAYFNFMPEDGIFIGTDARENWGIDEFKKFSKPYFDRGTAWDFKTLDRNIYASDKAEIAWFDELLETWMGICRGSGVMVKEDEEWKIKHYVLSVTIPNDNINQIIKINQAIDSSLVHQLRTPL